MKLSVSTDVYNLIWTALWLIFIGILCSVFNNGLPLWLLVLWLMGII